MELTLDTLPCDTGTKEPVVERYDAAAPLKLESAREGQSMRWILPATPRNDALFLDAASPRGKRRFNESLHIATVTEQGEMLLQGVVRLTAASKKEGYCIEIRDGAARWITQVASRPFNTLPIVYAERLTPTMICNSWTTNTPVRYFPILRDDYLLTNSSVGLRPAERILSVSDYHPFLHIGTLLQALFSDAGYTVESRFMAGDFFQSLYMSGAYTSIDTAAIDHRMGFFARRKAVATATANVDGRVYASPHVLAANTVGNFVDAFSPQETDSTGKMLIDTYANNGCFCVEDEHILFRPLTTVKVGFEFFIKYVTDYRIRSRTQLTGFDSIYLGANSDCRFTLTNPFKDRRGMVANNYRYLVVVFNHVEGRSYKLVCDHGTPQQLVIGSFTGRTATIITPMTGTSATPVLYVVTSASQESPYADDWALYDGYITETGKTEVEVTLRTASEVATPSAPKDFYTIYFYGAEAGMSFALSQACSLRPLFSQSPGLGSAVTFADLACHPIRQSVLIEALRHLFNLHIFTDEAAKTVVIEPEADFYDWTRTLEWSDKIDTGMPQQVTDCALEAHESRRYGYINGDGMVARMNVGAKDPFGEWISTTPSYAAKEGEQALINPLFAATVSTSGNHATAQSALVLQVGDRDDLVSGETFTPRIVSYAGLHNLATGETWGAPAPTGKYPLAAFHFAGDQQTAGFSLCFEDREGVKGLHRYYDHTEEHYAQEELITLYLLLSAREVMALHHRSDGINAGVDSIFCFRIEGVPLLCTLRSIERYDPQKPSVKCVFETQTNPRP
ncbi:MAG: hypothetical protein RR330_03130 [Alistipes sp.]